MDTFNTGDQAGVCQETVSLSDIGFGLIVAEGQLENAIREEKRWRLREDEACQMKYEAQDRINKWMGIVERLKSHLR